MMSKLTSRKFWVSIAAFLASIATSVAGLTTSEPIIATVGIICGVLSCAIYAACEAYVDAAGVSANGTSTSKVITATSNSNAVVQTVLQAEDQTAAAKTTKATQ